MKSKLAFGHAQPHFDGPDGVHGGTSCSGLYPVARWITPLLSPWSVFRNSPLMAATAHQSIWVVDFFRSLGLVAAEVFGLQDEILTPAAKGWLKPYK